MAKYHVSTPVTYEKQKDQICGCPNLFYLIQDGRKWLWYVMTYDVAFFSKTSYVLSELLAQKTTFYSRKKIK